MTGFSWDATGVAAAAFIASLLIWAAAEAACAGWRSWRSWRKARAVIAGAQDEPPVPGPAEGPHSPPATVPAPGPCPGCGAPAAYAHMTWTCGAVLQHDGGGTVQYQKHCLDGELRRVLGEWKP